METSQYFSPRRTRNKIKIEYLDGINKPSKLKKLLIVGQKVTEDNDSLRSLSESTATNKKRSGTKNSKLVEKEIGKKEIDDYEQGAAKWEPLNWQLTLGNLKTMRNGRDAPVDTMGCHKCGEDAPDEEVFNKSHIYNSKSNVLYLGL